MAFCKLGSVFGGRWLQFLLQANMHNVCSQPAWKWSKVLLLCNCKAHTALICSPAGETKPRGSSSLNKDTAGLPHGVWKANLLQTGSQAAERGLPTSFQLLLKDSSCYRPGASLVWIYWAQKQRCLSLPSLTSINSPITPSELPSPSASLTLQPMISLSHIGWLGIQWPVNQTHSAAVLYATNAMTVLSQLSSFLSSHHCFLCPKLSIRLPLSDSPIWCFSAVSLFFSFFLFFSPFLIFHSYLHLCLSLWNTSLHQPGLVSSTQWLQHQHPPPDKETDR